jgi:hypothetical protein
MSVEILSRIQFGFNAAFRDLDPHRRHRRAIVLTYTAALYYIFRGKVRIIQDSC